LIDSQRGVGKARNTDMKYPPPRSRRLDSKDTNRCPHRPRDECDARFTLHILGDCKLHTAFAASRDDEAELNGAIPHPDK